MCIHLFTSFLLSTVMSFRIAAKNLFLTYPQCPIKCEEAATQLKATFQNSSILYLHVVREKHEDGSPHLHVLICLEQKKSTTCASFADLVTENSDGTTTVFHGNYQCAKDPLSVKKYLEKDPVSTHVEGAIDNICLPGRHRDRRILNTFIYNLTYYKFV